jgi:hypothetical protein
MSRRCAARGRRRRSDQLVVHRHDVVDVIADDLPRRVLPASVRERLIGSA